MADGTLKVGTITTSSGSGTITLGQSGETVTIPTGATVAGAMSNTPAFLASSSGEVAVANTTETKINNYSVEILDTDGCFASSRFTPTTAGYYYIFGTVASYPAWTAVNFNVNLNKNGTAFASTSNYTQGYPQHQAVGIVYLNGSSDYVEVFCYQNSGSTRQIDGGVHRMFGGYKIIT